MRFDVLDEYSTLVPFGLGVSRGNRVVEHPAAPAKAINRGAVAKCVDRLKMLFKKSHQGKLKGTAIKRRFKPSNPGV